MKGAEVPVFKMGGHFTFLGIWVSFVGEQQGQEKMAREDRASKCQRP